MLIERVKQFLKDFKRTQATTHASSISFFVFMSTIPLLILYAILVPATGVSQQEVIKVLSDIVPDALDELVATLVNEAYATSGIALPLSTLTLLWTASKGATALRTGLNSMYDVEENRNRIVVAVISIAFILILLATLTIVLYLVFNGVIDQLLTSAFPNMQVQNELSLPLQSLAMFAVGTVVFAASYTYLTAGKRRFIMQLPGALLASVAWFLFSLGFHVYLEHFNSFAVFYGSLGAVALFLFWMYWIFFILLVGAFVNHTFSDEIEHLFIHRSERRNENTEVGDFSEL